MPRLLAGLEPRGPTHLPVQHGQAMLPDLKVTDSSEALLQGRAPPFRLLVRAMRRGGQPIPDIRYTLSEPFVVGGQGPGAWLQQLLPLLPLLPPGQVKGLRSPGGPGLWDVRGPRPTNPQPPSSQRWPPLV